MQSSLFGLFAGTDRLPHRRAGANPDSAHIDMRRRLAEQDENGQGDAPYAAALEAGDLFI
ncbi:hypothetical protein BFL28_08980 [Sphingomonas turrisvirgatae]|uniref:Uncharacterized protein n=1 Tax=Sphingomonas turrisvirgatae TaxID=1888892 RepID=A0A1E3M192_9SPHN|nr:hypothetical protein BFL28_08980 [Sphingomonas turrisvirgatae]